MAHTLITLSAFPLPMNREQRGNFLRNIITSVRTQDYPYDKRAPKKVDWHAYDVAQAHEIADILEIIRVSVDIAHRRLQARRKPKVRRGPPGVPVDEVVKVLLFQTYLGVSNRVAEGLTEILWMPLGLSQPFSYKTIERGYDRHRVDELLEEVLVLTNLPVKDLEKAFSVDGSGSPTRKKENYADIRERQRKNKEEGRKGADRFPTGHHDFVYSVFMVGATFKLISAWRNTATHEEGETSFFPGLLAETKTRHPGMEMVLGDGAYAGRPQCDMAKALGVVPRFLPRRNATFKRYGSAGWVDMLWALVRGPQEWLSEYYQREASENANSVIKNDYPNPLRKRREGRRCTEDRLRGLCYNLKRLCYLHRLVGLSVKPVLLAAAQ